MTGFQPVTPAKADIRAPKQTLGGGVIRLSPDGSVALGLGLCEGVETAHKILQSGWAPIWAVNSSAEIEIFPLLSGVESLTIFASANAKSFSAARECARRWIAAGREAKIICPRVST